MKKKSQLYAQELYKSANTFSLAISVVLFGLIIPDFFLLKEGFWFFLLLKLALVLIIYLTKIFYVKPTKKNLWWFHLVLLLFYGSCLVSIMLPNDLLKIIYVNTLAMVFTVFNTFIIWNNRNSLLQLLMLVLLALLFSYVQNVADYQFFVKNGGYVLFTLMVTTSLFPRVKKTVFEMKASKEQIKNKQIKELTDALQKNRLELTKVKNATSASQARYQETFDSINTKIKGIHSISLLLKSKYSSSIAQKLKQEINEISLISAEIVSKNKLFFAPDSEQDAVEITASEFDFTLQDIDFKYIYSNTLRKFQNVIIAKHLVVEEEITEDSTLVNVDEQALRLILQNMIQFSLHYAKENQTIAIHIHANTDHCFFEIFTNQSGLDYLAIEHVLQSQGMHKSGDLKLAKKLIEDMGGYFNYAASKSMGFELLAQFNAVT